MVDLKVWAVYAQPVDPESNQPTGEPVLYQTFLSQSDAKDFVDNETTDGVLTIQVETHDDVDPKVAALATHLGCSIESINEQPGGERFDSDSEPGEYLVLTDSEADSAFKESMQSYVEDMMHGWPETAKHYFDEDCFIQDALNGDGRGHTLAGYDSEENEAQIDGEWYFIYRVN